MKLIRLAIQRPVAVSMIFLAIILTGLAALSRLPLELIPDVNYPELSISTSWSDSSPEAVEALITAPIEAIANTVRNVHQVESTSREGASTVRLEFLPETDMDFAALELNEKLSALYDDLPVGAGHPQIKKFVPKELQTGQFLTYFVIGTYTPSHLREIALKKLKPGILGVKGVADVSVHGGQDPELRIELNPQKMQAFGVSPAEVQAVVTKLNQRRSVGRIFRDGQRLDLIIDEQIADLRTVGELVVAEREGKFVRLTDVARIEQTYAEPNHFTRINGQSTVWLNIEREAGTNMIEVADRVFTRVAALGPDLPPSVQLIKESDQSEQIRQELTDLSHRAVLCVLVIFLVLLVFLRSLKTPLIILSTIFISVLLTFNLFYFTKIGLNLITLAGLALGFGMLVDNSIVVVENIFRKHRGGFIPSAAAESGTTEVALAIVASTLTTVVVFIPFLYLTENLRLYYLPFAGAVSFSLLASLGVSFSFTPALTAQILPTISATPARQTRIKWLDKRQPFRTYLKWALEYRWWVVAGVVLLFAGSYFLFNKYVTRGAIWRWHDATYLSVWIRMPEGSDLAETDRIAREFEKVLVGHPELKRIQTNVSKETASIDIRFPRHLELTSVPLIWKEVLIQHAVQHAGVSVSVHGFGQGFYGGGGSAVASFQLKVLGYNYNEVRNIAGQVARRLERNARVREVDFTSSGQYGRSNLFELIIQPHREILSRFKVSVAELMHKVTLHLQENLHQQTLHFQGQELRYAIKLAGAREFNTEDLLKMVLESPAGEKFLLSEVAEISQRQVMSQIDRENQQYRRWITFEFRGPHQLGQRFVESVIQNTHLPPGYKLEESRYFSMGDQETQQIYLVLAVSLVLVFMVTAALFESLRQPFVVLLTVPLALIGVFLIYYLTDTNFDRNAYIGVILLGGIVVNNAILLIHQINKLREQGDDLISSIINATEDRVRPILMTTLTTVLGLLPLIIFAEEKASMWYTLALATIGGLLSSAPLVLFVLPSLFYILAPKPKS